MRPYLTATLALLIGALLTSCSANHTQLLSNALDPTKLVGIAHTNPPNLATHSNCPYPPSVKIVNGEIRSGDYLFYSFWPEEISITPKQLMDSVVGYLGDAFRRTGIRTDQGTSKIIEISMEKMDVWYDNIVSTYYADARLRVTVPEKQFSEVYGHTDKGPKGPEAVAARSIHEIVWEIVADPVVQNYVLCR